MEAISKNPTSILRPLGTMEDKSADGLLWTGFLAREQVGLLDADVFFEDETHLTDFLGLKQADLFAAFCVLQPLINRQNTIAIKSQCFTDIEFLFRAEVFNVLFSRSYSLISYIFNKNKICILIFVFLVLDFVYEFITIL